MDSLITREILDKNLVHYTGEVSETEIEQAEKTLGIKFDSQYREYIHQLGVASYEGHELTGICSFPRLNVVDVTLNERQWMNGAADQLYVLEQMHIDDMTIWQSSQGTVFVGQPGGSLKVLFDSLLEYINNR